MSKYFDLNIGLVLLKMSDGDLEAVVKKPRLLGLLNNRSVFSVDRNVLTNKVNTLVDDLTRQVNAFNQEDFEVNSSTDEYLMELADFLGSDADISLVEVAQTICSVGNRGGLKKDSEGFIRIKNVCLRKLEECTDQVTPRDTIAVIKTISNCIELLKSVRVFVLSQTGALAGVDEFPPSSLVDLPESSDPDFLIDYVEGVELLQLDHSIRVLSGMEGLSLNLDNTDVDYFKTVSRLNKVNLDSVIGNENKVLDAIKDSGVKLYESLLKSLDSVKKTFSPKSIKEQGERIAKKGEENKKALQAVKETGAVVNDKAKEGLSKLAEESDPKGAMSKVVSGLRTPGDGARVIDGLLGMVNKIVSSNSEVDKRFTEAKTALEGLRKSTTEATKGDGESPEVVTANKTAVQESIKAAKEKLKEVKEEVTIVKKSMSGLEKAITGINPKIFIKTEEE